MQEVLLGKLDQKQPKQQELMAPPKEGVEELRLFAVVKGEVSDEEKRNVAVVVHPYNDKESRWWVQGVVTREGNAFSANIQLGNLQHGHGEHFAVVAVAVAMDAKLAPGEMLYGLPDNVNCTKLKVVKRGFMVSEEEFKEYKRLNPDFTG